MPEERGVEKENNQLQANYIDIIAYLPPNEPQYHSAPA